MFLLPHAQGSMNFIFKSASHTFLMKRVIELKLKEAMQRHRIENDKIISPKIAGGIPRPRNLTTQLLLLT